jgi:hypothetical protein
MMHDFFICVLPNWFLVKIIKIIKIENYNKLIISCLQTFLINSIRLEIL